MNRGLRAFSRRYGTALAGCLARQEEGALEQAYEFGRTAIARGLGVLEMVRIHQQALAPGLSPSALSAAQTFFMEALSPFEAAHRGFLETNQRLQQLNDALQLRNAELATLNRDLRDLSRRVLHVQEEERKRISRELHDEVGQALTAIRIDLEVLLRGAAADVKTVDAKTLRGKAADMRRLLDQTMETVHRFARELRPMMLDELGLLPALRSYLRAFTGRTGIRAGFAGDAAVERLSSEQKTVLFRVAQEALTNVARHAQASRVEVTLRARDGVVRMEVRDNGKSFQVDRLAGKGRQRLGLLGARERVRLIDGRFEVESAPGKGSTVRVEIAVETAPPPKIATKQVATKQVATKQMAAKRGAAQVAGRVRSG
jgi:two-component system, NarL family, sensor histidine kinase DegS